jgi:hypothetical protein
MQREGNKLQHVSSAIAGAILAGSALVLAATTAYAASPTTTIYQAGGYGVRIAVGSEVELGPIAYAELPQCTPSIVTNTASATTAHLSGLVSLGAISSVASSTLDSSMGSSDIANVNILGGVITATEIKAVSSSSESDGVFSNSSEGSTFTGLKILGGLISVSDNPAPNTVIGLPGIGTVTLNEQTAYTSGDMADQTVNMIHVRVTLGLKAGTDIIIAQGYSSVKTTSIPAAMGGYAFAPKLVVGPVTSGPLVQELVPCYGTSGAVISDSTAETSFPGILNTGAVAVTVEGNVTKSLTSVQTTSSIAGVNLLSGLVSVSAINAVANASTTDGVHFVFSGGSTLVGLEVAGFPAIKDNPPVNTKVEIAGLGTLYLNRREIGADSVKIVPIELVVDTANTLGLAIGADLTVGIADAQLHNQTIP